MGMKPWAKRQSGIGTSDSGREMGTHQWQMKCAVADHPPRRQLRRSRRCQPSSRTTVGRPLGLLQRKFKCHGAQLATSCSRNSISGTKQQSLSLRFWLMNKRMRAQISKDNLERLKADPYLLDKLVCRDESPVYLMDPESKLESSVWLPVGAERLTKALRSRSQKRTMLTCFFDSCGPILIEFTEETIDSEAYIQTLRRLRERIRKKRPGMWQSGVDGQTDWEFVIQHDNASPHTSNMTLGYLFDQDLLAHPPYSPDLAPCDFFFSHTSNNACGVCAIAPWLKSKQQWGERSKPFLPKNLRMPWANYPCTGASAQRWMESTLRDVEWCQHSTHTSTRMWTAPQSYQKKTKTDCDPVLTLDIWSSLVMCYEFLLAILHKFSTLLACFWHLALCVGIFCWHIKRFGKAIPTRLCLTTVKSELKNTAS